MDGELRAYMVFLNHETKSVKASFVDKWSAQVSLMKRFHNSHDYSMAQISKFDQVVTHLKFQEPTASSQTEWSRTFKLLLLPSGSSLDSTLVIAGHVRAWELL